MFSCPAITKLAGIKNWINFIDVVECFAGIPVNQQHLLYNQKELSDAVELKDIPLMKGSRLKLVLNLKGGPVSARRVITIPDFDTTWFDLSEVLNK